MILGFPYRKRGFLDTSFLFQAVKICKIFNYPFIPSDNSDLLAKRLRLNRRSLFESTIQIPLLMFIRMIE